MSRAADLLDRLAQHRTGLAAIALSRGLRYFGLLVLAQIMFLQISHLGLPLRVLLSGLLLVGLLFKGAFRRM